MSFLDNLEDSLKSLETTEERDPNVHERRESDRAPALATAPWAEKLKTSDFTKKLFDEAALAGRRIRTKIYMAWFDNILRLEARARKLELRPTPGGIVAEFIEPDRSSTSEPLSLDSNPEALISKWLAMSPETSK